MVTAFDLMVEKMRKYCLYRDRCHFDVRSKLIKEKIYGDELEEIISILIEEDFLNEERFAKSFSVGKFRQNKWGRIKIELELKRRKVSSYCIKKGLEEIDEEEYLSVLESLWDKKFKSIDNADLYIKKQKVIRYLINKGFEISLINNLITK